MKCEHCGSAITAEEKIKKSGKRYVYYRCCNSKGNCENVVYLREEKVDGIFSEIVQKIQIPVEIVEITRRALIESHKDEKEYHDNALRRLNQELEKYQNMVDSCYEDKVMGRIDHDFWVRQTGLWKKKQQDILDSINFHKQANTKYLFKGVELLELAQNAYTLYQKQNFHEKRKLLQIILSNPRVENGTIRYDWKKPFDLMVKCAEVKKWGG